MLVRMVSSALSPGSIFASEPVARMTFFAWTLVAPLPSTATVRTPFFAGPVSLPNPGDDGDLVLPHQEVEAFDVLGDDLVLAVEHGLPVDLAFAEAFDAVFLRVLQVVVDLGVEEQRLGGDAAHMQAGSAQLLGLLDQRDLQAVLSGANRGCVSGGTAAEDGYVVDGFCQEGLRSGLSRLCSGAPQGTQSARRGPRDSIVRRAP